MRIRHVPVLIALAIAVAALLAAAIAGPAGATPSKTTVCTTCHSGAASGAVTATPSTSTPAAGAAYTVAINIGLTSSGNTGYHIASSDAAGTATTWTTVYSTIGSQTSWTANMTAPASAGTYYYKVWCVKGPNNSSGQAKAALYSITVPAPNPTAAITSLTPNHAQSGASVVIAGTNLGSGGTVRFGSTVATTSAWSATSVTATVPASLATGAATVTVQPTGGAASSAVAFTVDAPPAPAAALTSLSPASGPVGATLTITGTNMGASGAVTVGGITAATTAWSATSVTCTVPAGLTIGAKNVIVTPTGGAASNALTFTVTLPPAPTAAITTLTPNHAQTGASVVIAGTNLGSGGTVRFGATVATTTAWSPTSVTATVPAGLAAATTVTVQPTGGAASNAVAFTVDAPPAPTAAITSLTPNHARAGASVVIAGTNLASGGTVRFGTTVATTTAWSATSVTATVPAGLAAGATTITVQPTGGAASNAVAFTVDAPPAPTAAITSLTPNHAQSGASVVIAGTNLGSGGTVRFGATVATTTAWSPTSVTATVPAGLAAATTVTVQPTGGAASNAVAFTVDAHPAPTAAITSLAPNHAETGASIVIAGTALGTSGTVRFGNTVATTTAWSATSVTATVPAGLAAGATTVTVQPTGGAASNTVTFTVDAPPAPTDTTAPTSAASGVSADGWCNGAIAVTLTATDEAGGSGVASITYQVDGRAPVTVDVPNTTVDLDTIYEGDAIGMQGTHTIAYYSTDVAGNVEPSRALTIHHDSSRPTTRAPRAAAVRRTHAVALKYEVRDATPNAGTATVVIVIKNRHGKVVKRLHLGTQPVNTALTARFTCKLRAGTYRFSVQATDAAGNTQASAASQRLTVRPAVGS